ncbi:MAG TPA: hypothetical protein VK151_08600 [Fluviicola sp.]|nr:hypothetical protein [Fluviicola sp.]
MALKKFKTYSEFKSVTEAAEWDDPTKKKIDALFVSFDDDEKYEQKYFHEGVVEILKKEKIDYTSVGLNLTILSCLKVVPNSHPRKALLKCVLGKYGVDIEDIDN